MNRTANDLHRPLGTASEGVDPVVITPAGAGWRFCGLRVIRLGPGDTRSLLLGRDEAVVVPLSTVALAARVDGTPYALHGRPDVFANVPDYLYVGRGRTLELSAPDGGDVAIATAPARTDRPTVHIPASSVAVEARGAGRATRQVTNFLTPDVPIPDRLCCCEVLTPPGNWSSHPPHKHDDAASGVEAVLEEIYYFRIDGGTGAFGVHRTYDLAEGWDVAVPVRTDDVFLVPRGYHGPCMASPEHGMWYLNVLAGPGEARSMAITDDPAHAWIRGSWAGQALDPRVPVATAAPRSDR
jgi:5-deoxy-glucuronate isomerase